MASVRPPMMKKKPSREAVLADVFLVLLPAVILVPALLMGLVFLPVAAAAFAISDQPGGPAFVFALLSVVILGAYGLFTILRCVQMHWKGETTKGLGDRIGLWCGLISSGFVTLMLMPGIAEGSSRSGNSFLLLMATLLIIPQFVIYLYRVKPGGKA